MKITWITRSFLDYRIPVYKELNDLTGGNLTLIYYSDVVPTRVRDKTTEVLGENSIGLSGELRLSGPKSLGGRMANTTLRVPFQPGLINIIRASKPDIMVTDGFFQWTYGALFLRATRRIPHIMCYERTAHTERNAQWYRIAYRKIVKRWINAVCCNGKLCGEYTKSLGFHEEQITYGHMAADVVGLKHAISQVSPDEISKLKQKLVLNGLVYLYVGRLIPRKGIDKLLNAWKIFSDESKINEMTLLLVGNGPQRKQLEAYCTTHSLHNVCFTGDVNYDSIAPYYKVADLFVIPTLEDNWSLVVPEAMSCGLPVLCSIYNGCWPELVTKENGWVFDPLDSEDTSACLEKCLAARDRLPQMGQKSLDIVSHHTPEHAAKAILDACRIALDK